MDRLNKWLTLTANFGVLIGIGFLAYEVSVNTNSLNAATAAQMSTNWNEVTMTIVSNPELIELINQVNAEGYVALDQVESPRVAVLMTSMLKNAEFAYHRWLDGSLSAPEWQSVDRATRTFTGSNRFVREGWDLGLKAQFSDVFIEYMDVMLAEVCAQQDCSERDH
jgi:hypothetical protein